MPSESEVHVARSFLTKILRSSMRKNDLNMRPQSWHSSKLTDESEDPGRAGPPTPRWQCKHHTRSEQSVVQGHQDNQHLQKGQPGLTSKMDKEDLIIQPASLSLTKHSRNIDQACIPESKKDSGFSCLPSGSSASLHNLVTPERKGTSIENVFFKGLLNEAPLPPKQQSYICTRGNSCWQKGVKEGPLTSKATAGFNPSVGLVLAPGEKIQTYPPTSLCADSYAGTKVFPYSKGTGGSKGIHARSVEKLTETNKLSSFRDYREKILEARRSFNPLPRSDLLHLDMAVNPHKHLSLSSSDVTHCDYSELTSQEQQANDNSLFYLQSRSASGTKIQSVESYYRSLQDLPSNAPTRKQVRHSTATTTSFDANPAFGMAKKQSSFEFKYAGVDDRKDKNNRVHSKSHSHSGSLHNDHQRLEPSTQSVSPVGTVDSNSARKVLTYQCIGQNIHSSMPNDPWLPRENHRGSPQTKQQLYLTAQENRSRLEKHSIPSPQDILSMTATDGKCSNRYATSHRNDVKQTKQAQLQRSRSVAILTGRVEEEEEEWSSSMPSSYNSFSSTYKDNLKEAQARVLQATSFQRRDLEPIGPESFQASARRIQGCKRSVLAKRTHSFSEPDKIHKVGVEGNPQIVCFRERRKFLEVKPLFSRPVLKTSKNTDLTQEMAQMSKHKGNCPKTTAYSSRLSPRYEQVSEEQRRLGSFSEHQVTWSRQKKSFEGKTQGLLRSAENILDADVEVRASRSSDFNSQNMCTDTPGSTTLRENSGSQLDHSSHHRPRLDPARPSCLETVGSEVQPLPGSHLDEETTSLTQECPAERPATDCCPTSAGPHTSPEPGHRDTVEDLRTQTSMVLSAVDCSTPPKFSALMEGPPVLCEQEDTPPSTQVQCALRDPGLELTLPVKDQPSEEDDNRDEVVRDITGNDQSLDEMLDKSEWRTATDQPDEGVLNQCWTSAGSRLLTVPRVDEEDTATPVSSLVPSSSYYNTSAPKAELLIKMKDMHVEEQEEQDADLADKKHELIQSLAKKLQVLQEARRSLQEDVEDNEALGQQVDATVQQFCLSNQLERFRMFIGDLDKVVSLLLSLSGRLARVDNALDSLDDEESMEEKRTLTEKRKLLMRQHEDAKELKENLDRRERVVSAIMADHLDPGSLEDYHHFIKMKSALIIEQRRLEDKIKLGEEQLACLLESLPPERSMSEPEGGVARASL